MRLFLPLPSLIPIVLFVGAGGVFAGGVLAADGQLPESVSRIERETGGRVLSAEKSQRGGREMNRIKVYTPEGRVRVMWDDPQNERREGSRRGERGPRPAADAARQAIVEREASAPRDDG